MKVLIQRFKKHIYSLYDSIYLLEMKQAYTMKLKRS